MASVPEEEKVLRTGQYSIGPGGKKQGKKMGNDGEGRVDIEEISPIMERSAERNSAEAQSIERIMGERVQ